MKKGERDAGSPDLGRASALFPVSYAIFRLARTHKGHAADLLRKLDLHPGQELIIMALAERGPQPQSRLVELERLDHSTIAKSLRRMETAGIVSRAPSTEDRRAVVVSLTPKGRALHRKIEAIWEKLEHAATAGLTTADRATLLRIARVVEARIAEEDAR